MKRVMAVAAYRTRVTLARQWGALLGVVVSIGLLGGLSMGALAAARSTESSMFELAKVDNVADLYALDGYYNPSVGLQSGYNPGLLRTIRGLPHVQGVWSEVGLNAGPVSADGHPSALSQGLASYGSVDGYDFTVNRLFITRGRMANPRRANEFVADAVTAKLLGLRVGETTIFGWATNAQFLNFSAKTVIPRSQRFRATLVGIASSTFTSLFNDQNSASGSQALIFTPALTRRLLQCCSNDMISAIRLRGGGRYDAAVENQLHRVLPVGVPFTVIETAAVEATATRTLRPDAIALDLFGTISAFALLLIVGQMIVRRASSRVRDLAVMRALGASQAMTTTDDLIGILGAVILGTLLAAVVAVAISPLTPLGPVRPYLPVALRFDRAVLGLGCALIFLALAVLALTAAWRWAPHREATRVSRLRRPLSDQLMRSPLVATLPISAATGIRFALDPGTGRDRVPVRSAMLGTALAMIVISGNLTFGASLAALVSRPALYGWNWSYQLDGGGGLGDIPGPRAAALLNADPLVKSWAGFYFSSLRIDGVAVPVMGGRPNAPVGPAILTGHGFDGWNEVVLGTATLNRLHRAVGDTVSVSAAHGRVAHLTIVGTATMPAIGVAGSSHLEMGTGALLSYRLIPPGARNLFDSPRPGPNAILVRMRPSVSPERARRSLDVIANTLQVQGSGGSVLGVQRPAEIINYQTLGRTPDLLGAALAAGAAIGLAMTLVTLVRRRRRDLALLKTLGFTRRQLAATIAWQATVDVGLGCVVGVPLGVALGRYLWVLFARGIYAVPLPVVPLGTVLLVGLAALALANLAAALPGRIAAHTPTALLLRAE
ncbi:MAG: FtsX-like permease family protein [Acidimicrobiales bacterium]